MVCKKKKRKKCKKNGKRANAKEEERPTIPIGSNLSADVARLLPVLPDIDFKLVQIERRRREIKKKRKRHGGTKIYIISAGNKNGTSTITGDVEIFVDRESVINSRVSFYFFFFLPLIAMETQIMSFSCPDAI